MKKILTGTLLIIFILALAPVSFASAATSKTKKTTKTAASPYFHKLRLHHAKAPIPKDPKVTKADLKKVKAQKVAGKSYAKWIKGQLKSKKKTRRKV